MKNKKVKLLFIEDNKIDQLMFKRFVNKVYIACIATEREDLTSGPVVNWRKVMGRRSTKPLLNTLKINYPKNITFKDYRTIAGDIFLSLFSDTGIGFLIVHEKDSKEDIDSSYDVIEVVKPRD